MSVKVVRVDPGYRTRAGETLRIRMDRAGGPNIWEVTRTTVFTLDPAHRDEELDRVRLLSRALAARERFRRLAGL